MWRQYPTEIAFDLSFEHKRHISEWHRGTMSSRELLELIEPLPARSAFKTALRKGDWSDEEYRQARLVNELALSRVEHTGAAVPELEKSPLQQHVDLAVGEFRVQKHRDTLAQLRGERRVSRGN